MSASGWGWFVAWALAGALTAFALAALLSIGILILPFAALAIFFVARRSPSGTEAFGLLTGAGLIGVVVWVRSRGEWDATHWLVGGIALVASGVVAYVAVRARPA